jgi:hypothetical protein
MFPTGMNSSGAITAAEPELRRATEIESKREVRRARKSARFVGGPNWLGMRFGSPSVR